MGVGMARRHRRCVRPPHHLTSRNRGWTTPTTSWCLQTGRVCAHGRVTFRTRRLAARPPARPQQEPRRARARCSYLRTVGWWPPADSTSSGPSAAEIAAMASSEDDKQVVRRRSVRVYRSRLRRRPRQLAKGGGDGGDEDALHSGKRDFSNYRDRLPGQDRLPPKEGVEKEGPGRPGSGKQTGVKREASAAALDEDKKSGKGGSQVRRPRRRQRRSRPSSRRRPQAMALAAAPAAQPPREGSRSDLEQRIVIGSACRRLQGAGCRRRCSAGGAALRSRHP